jgi:hypothetical protein
MLVLFVAIVGLIAWGYFTSSLPAPFPTMHRTTAAETSSPSQGQLPTASPGKPFAYGSVLYTVGSISKSADIKQGTASFQAVGTFVQVPLTLANESKAPVTFTASDFVLHDSQGQVFSLHSGATVLACAAPGKTDLFAEALQPGLGIQVVLVFDVPKQVSGFDLRISRGFMDVNLGQ